MVPQTPHRFYRGGAFTLMEMLVIISIITLLISMTLPALNKSKETTRRAMCMINSRSQVQACDNYSVDNKDYFPPSIVGGISGSDWAYSFDLRASGGGLSVRPPRGIGLTLAGKYYDDQPSTLHCPSMDTSNSAYGTTYHSMDVNSTNWWNGVGATWWDNPAYNTFRIIVSYSYRAPSWYLTNTNNRFLRVSWMSPKFVVNVDIMDPRFGMLYTHRDGYNITRKDESTEWWGDPKRTIEALSPGGQVVDGVNRPTVDEIAFKKLETGS